MLKIFLYRIFFVSLYIIKNDNIKHDLKTRIMTKIKMTTTTEINTVHYSVHKLKLLLRKIDREIDHDTIDYSVMYVPQINCVEIEFRTTCEPRKSSQYYLQYSFDYNDMYIWNDLTECFTEVKLNELKTLINFLYS